MQRNEKNTNHHVYSAAARKILKSLTEKTSVMDALQKFQRYNIFYTYLKEPD